MPQTKRGRPPKILATDESLLRDLFSHYTTQEAALMLHVSPQTVRQACKRFGIPLRDKLALQILKNQRAWQAAHQLGRAWQQSVRPVPDTPRP